MMLAISIVLGSFHGLALRGPITTGTIKTQDGLFMSLILLTLSGVFFLNAYWELGDRGALAFLQKKKATAPVATAAAPKAVPKAASESKEA